MKNKYISLLMGFSLLFSVFFMGIPLDFNSEEISDNNSNINASELDANNISVIVGDILYYYYTNALEGEDWDEEEGGPEEGVVMVEVVDINEASDMIYYDLYYPNASKWDFDWDGTWTFWNDELGEEDQRWLMDNFSHPLFNHTYLFDNTITDLWALNQTENTDQKIMDAFQCNYDNFTSTYSDIGNPWNVIDFSLNKSNNPDQKFSVNAWINKTTGIMTYYEQYDEGYTLTMELVGYEGSVESNYPFYHPDSFGLLPGDWIDRFTPERNEHKDEWEEPDDRFEDNDDNNTAWYLEPNTVYGNLRLYDEDYFAFSLDIEIIFDIWLFTPPEDEAYLAIELLDEFGNTVLYDSNMGDNSTGLTFSTNYTGEYIIYIYGDHIHYGLQSSNGLGGFDDEYEDNDAWDSAAWFDLFYEEWNHFGPFVQNDADYYKFWLNEGDEVHVELFGSDTSNLELRDINPYDGTTIQSDSSMEDGYLEFYISASGSGEFEIGVFGPNVGDWYDLSINFENHNEYEEEEHPGLWTREWVEFVYHNPYSGEDGIIIMTEAFEQPDMLMSFGMQPHRHVARVNPLDPNSSIGDAYFHKDLDFTSSEFSAFILDIIQNEWNLSTHILTTGDGWVEVTGVTMEDGLDFYFFAEQLGHEGSSPIGTVRFFHNWLKNSTDEEYDEFFHREMSMVIDCSVLGAVKESHSAIGVDEGDWWQYLVQERWYMEEWDNQGYHWDENREQIIYATFTVTHIFALNRTVMGVVGSMEVQVLENDGSLNPEMHLEHFYPMLVFDTERPSTFVVMGGLGGLDGPPVLLPAGVNWTEEEADMIALFNSWPDGPGTPLASHYDEDRFHFRFDQSKSELYEDVGSGYWEERNHEWKQDITIDTNSFGMTTYLNMYMEERSKSYNSEGDEWERYKEEEMVAFMVNASDPSACVYEDDIASVTDLGSGDTFVWEHSRYHPAGYWGVEDPGKDPADKEHEKIVIANVLSAGDEYVVFLGAKYWKGPEDTTYQGHEWTFNEGEPDEYSLNLWYIGSIRDNDIWTWMQSNFFDIGITDLTGYTADIADMLNYAFAIPEPHKLEAGDILVNGTSFQISFEDEDAIEHVFRFAVSPEGVMQDMFMGDRYVINGTWISWERTVLAEAPTGYTVGEFFFDDIPADYVPIDDGTTDDDTTDDDTTDDDTTDDDSTDDDDSPFNIPGYPLAVMSILSLIAVVGLVFRKQK